MLYAYIKLIIGYNIIDANFLNVSVVCSPAADGHGHAKELPGYTCSSSSTYGTTHGQKGYFFSVFGLLNFMSVFN